MAEEQVVTKEFIVSDPNHLLTIVGTQDEYVSILESGLNVSINVFGNSLKVSGDEQPVNTAIVILQNILGLIEKGISVNSSDFVSALNMAENGTLEYFTDLYDQVLIKDAKNHAVRVKTFGQRQYVQAIRRHDIVFGVGPAGTGKTYLAVVMAVAALKKGIVDRIVLTRPAVEAGESLGFLPGDLKDKVDPYLRPIYDALHAILGTEHTERLLDRGIIEIAPLAYMRGRTLDNAFVILDEAQNTTNSQMKMFLTRLGFGSKMIVNGDVSQIDLPRNAKSGLVAAQKILAGIDQIEFVSFNSKDVVRHPVVSKIINAYEDNAG
ncbi:PhoH family protein [Lentilactobacillus curieae]|uniref:PhoH-like protein n=1 Tax=Lentilactobacillus curieae TaxID=1138822 RepID=A0A1S6QKK7_9LACO|nr:PhoH family protein [Lentilactobacillus curieae]AQW22120.1 PhoH family protein [Lentilactobacillus curieae]